MITENPTLPKVNEYTDRAELIDEFEQDRKDTQRTLLELVIRHGEVSEDTRAMCTGLLGGAQNLGDWKRVDRARPIRKQELEAVTDSLQ